MHLSRLPARLQQSGLLGHVHHEIFADGFLPGLAVKVQEGRLQERASQLPGALGGFHKVVSGDALRLEPLVHVKVEELGLHLGNPRERVGEDPGALAEGIVGEAGVVKGLERPERLDVLLSQRIALLCEQAGVRPHVTGEIEVQP